MAIGEINSTEITRAEYLLVLRRILEKAKAADKVRAVDSVTIGDKYTYCNVGLCTDSPEVWTRELNTFPDQYPERVSPRSRGYDKEVYCPLSKECKSMGCFYDCVVFQDKVKDLGIICSLIESRIQELEL